MDYTLFPYIMLSHLTNIKDQMQYFYRELSFCGTKSEVLTPNNVLLLSHYWGWVCLCVINVINVVSLSPQNINLLGGGVLL